ncbi:glycosyl hydrolase family 5 [Niastella yeongjuensis]|uniref:Glycosyl hydrolase family 5 n=1 Tax=Niastella yeongjuensis TaxID=354355 RepID=A0A1V9EAE9_9BACT|nr:glycoside hydrolase family 5 protein [Niastella yeongjuensis]OQP42905.1 glycosyl hydrolase family 5 [Niastella yeongjuensis]SEO58943.1 endoglucanase [Niastella yeongjuensis]
MKKISAVFLLAGIALAGSAQLRSVTNNGALKVVGTKLVNQKGQPVILRGMSLGWHNWWPRFYNAGAVSWLQNDWGCTVVRAAMGVEPDHGYIKEPTWSKEKVKEVINAAIKDGIYVIVDWHSHNIRLNEAKQFFTEIATEYGHQPNIIYEIFNEPAEIPWPDVKAYSEEVIKTIRAIDPDNVILVGSPHWDQDVHIVADDPIKGYNNLMYTLHFYAASHKQDLRNRGIYALKKGLPIFISESAGMEHTGNGNINEAEWTAWITWAEENKISWLVWSVTDKEETCSVLKPTASSTGNWGLNDLQPSGITTRALIRKYSGLKP